MTPASLFSPHCDLAQHILNVLSDQQTDVAHDLSHLLRVWKNVRKIAAAEGGDMAVLAAATLLHDAIHVDKDAPDRDQASRKAVAFATTVLKDISWPASQIAAVAHAIEAHSFSAGIAPQSLEARILQDADRLDALGHNGIARCFAVSGMLGRALYDPMDPMANERPLDDTSFALDHFSTKLLRLSDTFQTTTGKRLATKRHVSLQAFVDGLLAELDPM